MPSSNRRNFLKTLTAGTAGSLFSSLTSSYFTNLDYDSLDLKHFDSSETYWENVKGLFKFQPQLYYFNNASLGSSPIPVRKATHSFRDILDNFPSKYMWGAWAEAKEDVRTKVANLFSVSVEEIAIIHNTTEGMNLIARSFNLQPGDEVIIANHEHSSGTIPWEVWQETQGIKLIRPELPLIPKTKEEIISVYKNAISSRTKVISMCHIVNTNGMILPVKEVSEIAHKTGIKVAVDGAQSAGMFKIDLKDLGCDYYAASAHKWLFAPKGIGVFYARKESQEDLKPLIVARGHTDKSIRRLENYNTRNLPEYLALGKAIEFINEIGIDKIHDRSFELKHYFRDKVKSRSKFILKSPEMDELSCAIQTLEIKGMNVKEVNHRLFNDYGIDSRPMTTYDLNGVRLSFGIYITKSDIDYLVNALDAITA